MVNPNISQGGLNGSGIGLVSWNVCGLGGPIKRSKVVSHLKGLNADIAFLQETHLRIHDHCRMCKPCLCCYPYQQMYSVLPWPDYTWAPWVLLLNVYSPKFHILSFFEKIKNKKIPNLDSHLILGGDLNLAIDLKLDWSHPKVLTLSAMSKTLSSMNESIWLHTHLLHPFSKEFSYFSKTHQAYSCIDWMFCYYCFQPRSTLKMSSVTVFQKRWVSSLRITKMSSFHPLPYGKY